MAIRKHEVVQNQSLDLDTLVKYIELLNEQPNLPPANEIIKTCVDIVSTLARHDPLSQSWTLIQEVEEYLLRVVNCVEPELRHDVITTIVGKLNQFTSDPQSAASPISSIVLVVLSTDVEHPRAAARWLVQQGDVAGGMRASLACLYSWMYQWDGTPSLGEWVMCVIKALEENERFDVLIEASLEHLGNLVATMAYPTIIRRSYADVILHVLASLRESKEALDAVAPHVDRVLTELASDSGQFSRDLLENIVDILSCMVNRANKEAYADMVLRLEAHMASRGCEYLQLIPWRATTNKPASAKQLVKKVGLTNLGNTCYMNSVMQALLLTKQFSSVVMTRMSNMPYWAKMSILFAKMMHSICSRLNPDDFFKVVKPPFFTTNNQHDSSEFLGYLFQLLQSFENRSDRNFDYSKPPVLTTTTRWLRPSQSSSTNLDVENNEPTDSSSKPSGSGSVGTASGSLKRPKECEPHLPKKRMRISESPYVSRRSSFIDNIFGGVILTRVECIECHSTSISRDVFRDLQLAFPDKPDEWQHSVQSLLEFYCTKEMLTGDNQYHCRECGRLRDAERSVSIEVTPKYLILVLKNFKFDPKLQVQNKLMHKVFHNQTVTLPTVRPVIPSNYSLYAAVIHSGTTLDSGHYYTLAKDADADAWYNYNDDEVEITTEQEINRLSRCCTPYVLFYKRTDVDEGVTPDLLDLPPKLQECVMAHNKPYVGVQMNGAAHISRP